MRDDYYSEITIEIDGWPWNPLEANSEANSEAAAPPQKSAAPVATEGSFDDSSEDPYLELNIFVDGELWEEAEGFSLLEESFFAEYDATEQPAAAGAVEASASPE